MYPKFLRYMVVKSECKRNKSVKDQKMVVKCERKRNAVRQLEQNRSSTVRMHRRPKICNKVS